MAYAYNNTASAGIYRAQDTGTTTQFQQDCARDKGYYAGSSCFFFVNTPYNFNDAAANCISYQGNLTSLHTARNQQYLTQAMEAAYNAGAVDSGMDTRKWYDRWLGAVYGSGTAADGAELPICCRAETPNNKTCTETVKAKWQDNGRWPDGRKVDWTSWGLNEDPICPWEPNHSRDNELCLRIGRSNEQGTGLVFGWRDISCMSELASVCQRTDCLQPEYCIDEAPMSNKCSGSCDCDGMRTCSDGGYCMGTARPNTFPDGYCSTVAGFNDKTTDSSATDTPTSSSTGVSITSIPSSIPTSIPTNIPTTAYPSSSTTTTGGTYSPPATQTGENSTSGGSNSGVIVGAVVGVCVGAIIAGAAVFFVIRRRRSHATKPISDESTVGTRPSPKVFMVGEYDLTSPPPVPAKERPHPIPSTAVDIQNRPLPTIPPHSRPTSTFDDGGYANPNELVPNPYESMGGGFSNPYEQISTNPHVQNRV
eukprot:comp23767_c4_seq1/m.41176 comp23767_c4_seq1/g.41176  ORF comp23767_c4_seq1/g.41176 comp23767_c4_seq1/m.41176 type:complete len:479 (-) comp23767_c4_seq1:312-1748(-)